MKTLPFFSSKKQDKIFRYKIDRKLDMTKSDNLQYEFTENFKTYHISQLITEILSYLARNCTILHCLADRLYLLTQYRAI